MRLGRKISAEFLGTFWLVFAGCGSAVLASTFYRVGIGLLGIAIAFGLSVLTMAYAIGHVSGCHLNPAVTVGLAVAGRHPFREVPSYVLAQLGGGIVAAFLLWLIASGAPSFNLADGLASNGYGAHSPGGYTLQSALVTELVMTFLFLFVILGATDKRAPEGFAPIAIGLMLTLIHLVSIPVTGTSVNPARSTAPALVARGWALSQLWLFWIAPLAGAVIAGYVYPRITGERAVEKEELHEPVLAPH